MNPEKQEEEAGASKEDASEATAEPAENKTDGSKDMVNHTCSFQTRYYCSQVQSFGRQIRNWKFSPKKVVLSIFGLFREFIVRDLKWLLKCLIHNAY